MAIDYRKKAAEFYDTMLTREQFESRLRQFAAELLREEAKQFTTSMHVWVRVKLGLQELDDPKKVLRRRAREIEEGGE